MLFRWLKPKCPIADDDRLWIERRLTWLCEQFGRERLQLGTVVLPTADFFPEAYHPTEEGAGVLLQHVCEYMSVDPARAALAFFSGQRQVGFNAELFDPQGNAAGYYDEQSGRITIWLEVANLNDPHSVVATLAHELAHVHLLGDKRVGHDEPDHEPLTDLLTTFLGLGIFTANDVLRDASWSAGGWSGWRIQRHGYLTAPLHGYALAWCAWCRGEDPCPWREFLRADVGSVFDSTLRYLKSIDAPRFPNCATGPATPPGAFKPPVQTPDEALESLAPEEPDQQEEPDEDNETRSVKRPRGRAAADLCFERALVHHQAGEVAEAMAEVTEAIELSPNDPEFYTLRANIYSNQERYREALKDAEKAVSLDPEDTDARHARGAALLDNGNPAAAKEDFDFLIREDREDPYAYYRRGLAFAALGDHKQAVKDYSKAITKHPNLVEAYFARHEAYKELGQLRKAEADLREGEWRREQLGRGP